MALLEVVQGENPGKLIELDDEKLVIGRHPTSNIVLENHAVSRRHARIIRTNGLFFVEDLRSRNGTWLNGQRLQTRTPLRDDDEIKVCDVLFRFLTSVPHRSGISPLTGTTSNMPAIPPRSLPEIPGGSEPVFSSLDLTSIRSARLTIKPEIKLRALLEIIDALRYKLNFDELLPSVLQELLKIFPQAERGMFLSPDDLGHFHPRSVVWRHERSGEDTRISQTLLQEVLKRKQAILSEDASSDSRFVASESLHDLRIRSMMCVPLVDRNNEVLGIVELESRDLQTRFTEEDLELMGSTASILGLSVENARLHEETLKQRDLERELEFATQVQIGFLPTDRPRIPNFEFMDYYEPAHSVGGDIFDYIEFKDGRWAIVVGDVSGKGVPAALLMARVYSLIRGQITSDRTAAQSLTALNQAVSKAGLGHSFITMALIILDPVKRTLEWANAGHVPPLLRKREGTIVEFVMEQPDFPLGVKSDQEYHQGACPLAEGDLVVLVTDGVTETMDAQRQLFGTERIKVFLGSNQDRPQDLMEGLIEDIENFRGSQPQRDDMCLIAFQCRG